MPLSNTLPTNYDKIVLSIISNNPPSDIKLEHLFDNLNPRRIIPLSDKMRNAFWRVPPSPLINQRYSSVDLIKSIKKLPSSAPIMSVSADGYVREVAVRYWPRINNSFELGLLLLRLNDWVKPIRQAAITKIEEFISMPADKSGLTPETLLGCMDLILDSKRFGRSKEIEFRVLNQLTNINGAPQALSDFILNSPLDKAPRYLKLGLQKGILTDALHKISLDGKHTQSRQVALKALLNDEYVWKKARNKLLRRYEEDELPPKKNRRAIIHNTDKVELLTKALNDSSPPIIRVALDFIINTKPKVLHSEQTYRRFVQSKRMSISERAIYGLRSLGLDYIDELRTNLRTHPLPQQSLNLLARYGNADDGALICLLYTSPSPRDATLSRMPSSA